MAIVCVLHAFLSTLPVKLKVSDLIFFLFYTGSWDDQVLIRSTDLVLTVFSFISSLYHGYTADRMRQRGRFRKETQTQTNVQKK